MTKFSSDFFSKDYFFWRKNSNYSNYNLWDNDRYWKHTINMIKKYNIKWKALDIGCAFGFLVKRFEPYFEEVCGIDISSYAIQIAKNNTNSNFFQLDINMQDIPYPSWYFDLITVFDVLEHTCSIDKTLEKIIEKLNKDWYMVISLPIRDTWAWRIFNFFDKDLSHVNIPSKEELFDIIKKNNLRIVEKKYFLNLWFMKLRWIPVDIEIVLKKIIK